MQAAPVDDSQRIVAMDVLRGFVLLGILVMNIQSFAMPIAAYVNPTAYGDLSGANLYVWIVSHVFFDQKFLAAFSMLFGAGIVLMTTRHGADGRRLHRRRMGWMILFGLLHAYLFWYGDILFAYGVCGLVAYGFRDRDPALLIRAAAALLLVGALVPVAFGLSMPPERAVEMSAAAWSPSAEVIESELAAYRGDFVAQSRHRVPEALKFQTLFMIFFTFWRVLGLMLLGMALLRLDVLTARRPARAYAALAAAGFAIGLPLVAFGVRQNFAHGWSAQYSMFFGGVWNYWGSVFVAVGYVGLLMAITRAGALSWLTVRLGAVGRMAFSNYILQTLLATTIFYGHGLGLFGSVERTGQIAIVLAIWLVQLTLSPLWLRRFRFGPLEWLWRSLTYGERQVLRRTSRASS